MSIESTEIIQDQGDREVFDAALALFKQLKNLEGKFTSEQTPGIDSSTERYRTLKGRWSVNNSTSKKEGGSVKTTTATFSPHEGSSVQLSEISAPIKEAKISLERRADSTMDMKGAFFCLTVKVDLSGGEGPETYVYLLSILEKAGEIQRTENDGLGDKTIPLNRDQAASILSQLTPVN